MACVFLSYFFFFLRETYILGIRPRISDTDRNAKFFFFLFTFFKKYFVGKYE